MPSSPHSPHSSNCKKSRRRPSHLRCSYKQNRRYNPPVFAIHHTCRRRPRRSSSCRRSRNRQQEVTVAITCTIGNAVTATYAALVQFQARAVVIRRIGIVVARIIGTTCCLQIRRTCRHRPRPIQAVAVTVVTRFAVAFTVASAIGNAVTATLPCTRPIASKRRQRPSNSSAPCPLHAVTGRGRSPPSNSPHMPAPSASFKQLPSTVVTCFEYEQCRQRFCRACIVVTRCASVQPDSSNSST